MSTQEKKSALKIGYRKSTENETYEPRPFPTYSQSLFSFCLTSHDSSHDPLQAHRPRCFVRHFCLHVY